MARVGKGSYAPSVERRTYLELAGLRCVSSCLRMWRGCRSLTCLHGTRFPPASRPRLSCLMKDENAERGNPVPPPGAISGRHYRKACRGSGGRERLEEANAPGKAGWIGSGTWPDTETATLRRGEACADVQLVSCCEIIWRTFRNGRANDGRRIGWCTRQRSNGVEFHRLEGRSPAS